VLGPRDQDSRARFGLRAEPIELPSGIEQGPGNVTKCHTQSKISPEKYKQTQ